MEMAGNGNQCEEAVSRASRQRQCLISYHKKMTSSIKANKTMHSLTGSKLRDLSELPAEPSHIIETVKDYIKVKIKQ